MPHRAPRPTRLRRDRARIRNGMANKASEITEENGENGGRYWVRTNDLIDVNDALYQLS